MVANAPLTSSASSAALGFSEAISDLVTRGGFPPVLLAPVSFEALYAQRNQGQPDVPLATAS